MTGAGFPNDADVLGSDRVTEKGGQTLKSGVPFGIAAGIKNDACRLEIALGYQTNKVDTFYHVVDPLDDSVTQFTSMVNGYYDVELNNSSISPYVTAGIGGDIITSKNEGEADRTTTVFAWQLGAGIGIKATSNLTIDFGYRFLKPSSFTDSFGTYKFSNSNFLAGIRYEFN